MQPVTRILPGNRTQFPSSIVGTSVFRRGWGLLEYQLPGSSVRLSPLDSHGTTHLFATLCSRLLVYPPPPGGGTRPRSLARSIEYLTGTKDQVAKAAKSYRVYFSKTEEHEEGEDYMLDHSIVIYLLAPNGEFLDFFTQRTTVRALDLSLGRCVLFSVLTPMRNLRRNDTLGVAGLAGSLVRSWRPHPLLLLLSFGSVLLSPASIMPPIRSPTASTEPRSTSRTSRREDRP